MDEEEEEEQEENEEEEEGEQNGQRPLGCLSESLRISLGSGLKASWGVLGTSWWSRKPSGASWVPRGISWGLLGVSWEPLEGLLGASWGLLGASWGPLGPSWRRSIKKRGSKRGDLSVPLSLSAPLPLASSLSVQGPCRAQALPVNWRGAPRAARLGAIIIALRAREAVLH